MTQNRYEPCRTNICPKKQRQKYQAEPQNSVLTVQSNYEIMKSMSVRFN